MYRIGCLFIFMSLFISCAKTSEEEIRSSIAEAKYLLSSMECSRALSILDDVDFQDDNADYISVYASAQACSAGYKELDLFGDDLSSISSSGLIQSLAAFDSSLGEATVDSAAYQAMDSAITTLLSYDEDAGGQPSTLARATKFGIKKSGDLSLQALYMIFSQLGRHFAFYGNADPDDATKGEKGGGAQSNSCLFSYTTQDAVDWITTINPGTCVAATGSEGSDFLEAPEASADIKRRLCQGIIYYNNMMDILGNVTLPGSDSLGDVSNIQTALNTLMLAAEAAESGVYNDGAADGINAITTLKVVTSQSVCEAVTTERIEKWYAIFFETVY
jgi:hypothetical protein